MASMQSILFFTIVHIMKTHAVNKLPADVQSTSNCPGVTFRRDIKDLEKNCLHQVESEDELQSALERFRVHTDARTWIEAVGECWREGGMLATPVNEAEARLLGRLLEFAVANMNISGTEMGDAMHIGVHDMSKKGYFTDISGREVKFTPWLRGTDISLGLQYCVRILTDGHYTYDICKEKLIFACDMHEFHTNDPSSSVKKDDGYVALTGSSHYRLQSSPLPWLTAVATCFKDGAMLAEPVASGEAVQQAMTLFFDSSVSSDRIFVGLTDIVEEGHWRDAKGNIIKSPIPWMNGTPNANRASNCGAITPRGEYSDVSCKVARPYLCEKKAEDLFIPKYVKVEGVASYAINIKRKNWLEAAFQCQSENATLVIPDSPEKVEVLEKLCRDFSHENVDLRREKISIGVYGMEEGEIRRTLNGKNFPEFRNMEWTKSENFYFRVFCGALQSGEFHFVPCEEENMFICEMLH